MLILMMWLLSISECMDTCIADDEVSEEQCTMVCVTDDPWHVEET